MEHKFEVEIPCNWGCIHTEEFTIQIKVYQDEPWKLLDDKNLCIELDIRSRNFFLIESLTKKGGEL
ncbi:MAG: hypothetical protein Q8P07_04875 [bacterium]|nr:hypothetical protein [bacterium]